MVFREDTVFMKNTILHSDLNAFYASVEMLLFPELEGKPVAVCGSVEDRHGIVLAKSELAKKAGVKTGMAIWQAKQVCPNLIVRPPRYEKYMLFSKLVRKIYARYTDQIEPFGLDENWLDVSGSLLLFGSAEEIAEQIRKTVKEEIGLTVSIGVSFNKVFAKLGSDLKKPDAITVISEDNFKEKIWPLPVEELLYVGRATKEKLHRMAIYTIGDLARADLQWICRSLGKAGGLLWSYANGMDRSKVVKEEDAPPIQSVGHGITTNANLISDDEVRRVMLELSQEVGFRLEEEGALAGGIQIEIKDSHLVTKQYMASLPYPTRSRRVIADAAFGLYLEKHKGEKVIRAVTVRAVRLQKGSEAEQLDCFGDHKEKEKLSKLEKVTDSIAKKFGQKALQPADILTNDKTKSKEHYVGILPGGHHR